MTPNNIVTENDLIRIFSTNYAFLVIINNKSCDWQLIYDLMWLNNFPQSSDSVDLPKCFINTIRL